MKQKIEPVEDESDIPSSECEVYVPLPNEQKLEVDEKVYHTLEYISLDWPSQTIIKIENEILVCTNPADATPSIVIFNFEKTESFKKLQDFEFEKIPVAHSYNRMRVFEGENRLCKNIACLSDDVLSVYNKKLKLFFEKKNGFSYGLCTHESSVLCGLKNGSVVEFEINRNCENEMKIHDAAVESIEAHENLLFTASVDKTVKVTDLRTKMEVKKFNAKNEINAVSYNGNGGVLYGDDDGIVYLADMKNEAVEVIEWHKTPINYVKWKDNDVFLTCSDEQVVLWDKSFEEEWEYHKYLSFVHQGQKMYKEACFYENGFVFTTSYEGICIFKPMDEI